jgi:hypothetical protein
MAKREEQAPPLPSLPKDKKFPPQDFFSCGGFIMLIFDWFYRAYF